MMREDGRVGECVFISSCKSTKIATSCWTTMDRRTPEPPKKWYSMSKTKRPVVRWQSSTITIKWNPITAGWVTHKLENNNTKEVLPLLQRFWTSPQVSQPGDLIKGLGIPMQSDLAGQRDLITGLSGAWGRGRLQSWRAQTKFCTYQDRGERSSDSTGHWTKITC